LPILGYGRMRKFGHAFGVLVVAALLAGAATLTVLALVADRNNALFQEQARVAEEQAARAVQLADAGIPADGAANLLRRDPLTAAADPDGQELLEELASYEKI